MFESTKSLVNSPITLGFKQMKSSNKSNFGNKNINQSVSPFDIEQNQINNDNEYVKLLDLLPKSDFKRGFVKINDDYHYYILNEIHSNSYSKSFSAVRYTKSFNNSTNKEDFILVDESYCLKFYPKYLLLEYFTESELTDLKFSFFSKYKNLSEYDSNIQTIYDIVIANDCVLVVTELLENNLKDFLIKNKDICKESRLESKGEIRIEWYFGKLIYEIIKKLNEYAKKRIYFGSLINTHDIYVRNIDLDLIDIIDIEMENTIQNESEDINFVFTNPFFYEIETVFKSMDNNIISYTYPPEFLKHLIENKTYKRFMLFEKNVFFYRTKEEKEIYKQNTDIRKSFPDDNLKYSKKNILDSSSKNLLLQNKMSSSTKEINIMNKKNSSEFGKKTSSNKIDVNELEKNLLVTDKQREQFDAWMIGMLIFDIIFNSIPEDLSQKKDMKEIKEFYLSDKNIFDFIKRNKEKEINQNSNTSPNKKISPGNEILAGLNNENVTISNSKKK